MKEVLLAMLPFVIIPPLIILIWAAIQRRKHPLSQDARMTAKLFMDLRWLPSGWMGLAFTLVYAVVYSIRKFVPLPEAARMALLVVPVLAFVWFFHGFHREVREGDELVHRIHLDALTGAFSMFMGFAIAMWVMRELDPAPRRGTYEMSLGFLPLFYFVGLFAAKARYMPTSRSDDAKV